MDAALLATLKWAFHKFPEMAKPGIDSSNLFCGKKSHGMDVLGRFQSYQEGLKRSVALFEGGRPDPLSIKQGMRGSCTLLAGLTVMADRDPQRIVDSVREEGDGFRVALATGDQLISKPTDTERLTGTWANGVWVTVYEKAFAQQNPKNLPDTGDVYDNLNRGLSPAEVIYDLSGQESVDILSLGALPKKRMGVVKNLIENALPYPTLMTVVHEELVRAKDEGRMVIAASSRDPRGGDDLKGSHAFAVTDYDQDSLEVTLRNPWGKNDLKCSGCLQDDQDDGVFKATIDGFLANFHSISVAADEFDAFQGKPLKT